MSKRTIIISSLLAIILCVAVIVGSTFSLFTGASSVDISFTSGKVKVKAEITEAKVYSAVPDASGDLEDEFGSKYSYQLCEERVASVDPQKPVDGIVFANGGTATFENDLISLKNVSAGDKVVLDVKLKNESSIRVIYKAMFSLVDQEQSVLFDALEMTAAVKENGGERALEVDNADQKSKSMSEEKLTVGQDAELSVSIGLPISAGNGVTDRNIKLRCSVFAVQDTTEYKGVAGIEQENGDIEDYSTLQAAIDAAEDNATIYIMRANNGPVEEVVISKPIKFESYNGVAHEFEDIRVTVVNTYAEFSGMLFTGNSYIDVSSAVGVSVHDCEVESYGQVYDPTIQAYIGRRGFILSNKVRQSGIKLEVYNNKFFASDEQSDYSAVYVEAALESGSYIKGNEFGTPEKAFPGYGVEIVNVVKNAVINIEDNKFYGENAFAISSQGVERRYAILANNEIFGTDAKLLTVNSGTAVDIFDNGSKANGSAVKANNFALEGNTRFVVFNVSFYEYNQGTNIRITGGDVYLVGGYSQNSFKQNYVVSGYTPNYL